MYIYICISVCVSVYKKVYIERGRDVYMCPCVCVPPSVSKSSAEYSL